MPNIKPVTDLRNYNEVIKDTVQELLSKLGEAEKVIETGKHWLTSDDVKKELGL